MSSLTVTREAAQEIVVAKRIEGDRIGASGTGSHGRCCVARLIILMGYLLHVVKLIVVIEYCIHKKELN